MDSWNFTKAVSFIIVDFKEFVFQSHKSMKYSFMDVIIVLIFFISLGLKKSDDVSHYKKYSQGSHFDH